MFYKEKQQLVDMSLKLYADKLIVGTWGNLSLRVKKGEKNLFVVTPSGMDYEKTEVGDIIIVDDEGNLVEGIRKPTSELKMHLEIYKEREEINAVFHTHSTSATSCAVAGLEIPMLVEDMIQHIGGGIRVAEYALPGTNDLAKNAVKALQGRRGVLLKNHGAIGIGEDVDSAYKSCVLIEKSAQIFINCKMLGSISVLSEKDAETMVKYYNTSYGQK